ncbi:LysR substrate-binding domain-containing protein [Catenulispora yoronensis]
MLFTNPCIWRTSLLQALESADRRWRVTFESNSLIGVLAALRAGLGVTALMPSNLEPSMACRTPDTLPPLPDLELGLTRRPRSEGDALVDAVEMVLRRTI